MRRDESEFAILHPVSIFYILYPVSCILNLVLFQIECSYFVFHDPFQSKNYLENEMFPDFLKSNFFSPIPGILKTIWPESS